MLQLIPYQSGWHQANVFQSLHSLWLVCLLAVPASATAIEAARSGEAKLSVRFEQTSYKQAIDTLQKLTRVPIHYSLLPDQTVSVQCSGQNLHEVLICLFGHSVDWVVRIADNKPSEVWLMPVVEAENPVAATTSAMIEPDKGLGVQDAMVASEAMPEISQDHILDMLKGEEPEQRADGILLLAADPRFDDNQANEILLSALHDQSPDVRAQALHGLAKRQGSAATDVLQAALLDSDEEVRIMAIDNAGGNTAILEQALSDNSVFVSSYAARKLAELGRR